MNVLYQNVFRIGCERRVQSKCFLPDSSNCHIQDPWSSKPNQMTACHFSKNWIVVLSYFPKIEKKHTLSSAASHGKLPTVTNLGYEWIRNSMASVCWNKSSDSLIVRVLCKHYRFTQIFSLYLWFYFKTLELLFVVNSGVVCYVVQTNSLPITA